MARFVEDTHNEVVNMPEPRYYGVSNPHPLHGKNPNVINEMGHTLYPQWVDTDIVDFKLADGTPVMKRKLVKDKKEHDALLGKKKEADKPKEPEKPASDWKK